MKTIPVGKYEVIVDDWNYDRVAGLRLVAGSGVVGVVWGKKRSKKSIPLSKILILTDAPMVDHKDRNWLNNQVSNLRPCTKSQNQANHRKPVPSNGTKTSSKYKGVTKIKNEASGKVWSVKCQKEGKQYYGGLYSDEDEAARAYDRLATELHGEFALLNF